VQYIVDPFKIKEFVIYGKMLVPLVEKFGGQYHGYFRPYEGANNIAMALFSFSSFATYENYRASVIGDPACQVALRYFEVFRPVFAYDRSQSMPPSDCP
jgi:NIPSNAP